MRVVISLCCSILLLSAAPLTAAVLSVNGRMVVKIVDDNQIPVEGAKVTCSFRNYPSNIEIKCVTDKEGICKIKGGSSNEGAIQVKKEGYYYSSLHFDLNEENSMTGHHESWGDNFQVVLKKKRNPVSMYAKNTAPIKVPLFEKPVGYDLEIGDWVSPHGEGIVSDFVFLCKNNFKDYKNAETACEISFTNENDGIQIYHFPEDENSIFKWPFEAPKIGYKSGLNKWMSIQMPGEGYKSNIVDETNYIFRVRTILDEQGNIVNANYGKIFGDISIDRSGYIKFIYYFNPDGTPNLEFDPKQNIFKFSRKERWKHRVQRP